MQSIPRLSSTSINNKHLHETRASLGGSRRHRPARSTSDETHSLLLSLAFAFYTTCLQYPGPRGTIFTYAFSHLSELQLYQLWQRRLSSFWWWHWAPVAPDKGQTLSSKIPLRPWCAFFPFYQQDPYSMSSEWHLGQHSWHDRMPGWGS